MKIHHCKQYSPDWWALRRAIPTASSFDRIITNTGKVSEQQIGYVCELVGEIIDYHPPIFSEADLNPTRPRDNGLLVEPEARSWYAVETGLDVHQVGFITTDDGRLGCSPDGLVLAPKVHNPKLGTWDENAIIGCVELKCPLAKTHVEYLVKGVLPTPYRAQCHGQLIVTGAKYVDFMSYHAGMKPLLIRVQPDEFTEKLRAGLTAFLKLYEEVLDSLQVPYPWVK